MSERLQYIEQLESQIATTKTTLEALKAEREKALVEVQHEEIENLEKYLDEANVNLQSLSESAEDAWHELKVVIEQLMNDMSNSLKRLLGQSDDS